MRKVKNIPTKWNLTPLFRSDDDPKMKGEREKVKKESYKFINKWKGRRDYLENPKVLASALKEYELWRRLYGSSGRLGYYFMLRTEQDQNNPELKAKFNNVEEWAKRIENDIQFFTLNIAKVPRENQRKFLAYEGLTPYKHFLERLFAESKYLLSEAEEKILNLKSATSHENWVKMTQGFLSKESRKLKVESEKGEIKERGFNFSEIMSLINDSKKRVRDSAASAINEILKKHVDVAEAELNSVLRNKKTDDELRGISRPDLTRHMSDDIESKTVDTLIEVVSGSFGISRKFYALKAKLLGVKKLEYHERGVEYGGVSKRYSYPQAVSLVGRVSEELDPEFALIFKDFVSRGQIDVYPIRGRAGGAFCAHQLISQPTYILLNHTGKLNDVLTLAHELGHGINNELMRKKQNSLNFNSSLATAEVASTFMEDFVIQKILAESDDELKLALMMAKLNDDVSTIFRQVAAYRFEQELHQVFRDRGYLSKEEVGKLFQTHMASYMGGAVLESSGSENWWVYWSHFRRFFYVYSYASGLLTSKSLQASVKNNPAFIEKVKEFLTTGQSDSPQNIFLRLGIDIREKSFWLRGLKEVEALLEGTFALAKKLKKI
ncbi:MAG TPA: M3 family oligoendopeptidase [Candidatus Paceibacterota bacterium]